jgi:P-type Cu+ transporter
MTIDPASAARKVDYDGTTYYFCSVHCLKLFQTDPAKYLAAAQARQSSKPSASSAHQHHAQHLESKPEVPSVIYTCPMDPEVRQSGAESSQSW